MSTEIKAQYTRWPYPDISIFASVSREQLWQINVEWMLRKAGLGIEGEKAKIWIAGCGTFQPYLFSQANPNAEILATDISPTSLKIAKKRAFFHLQKNIFFQQVDLEDEQEYPPDTFDFIECYGVLMNLKDPGKVLERLSRRLKPGGLLRIMVYPHYGRQKIFQIQKLAKLLGLDYTQPHAPRLLKAVIKSLQDSHPLKESFFSYHDTRTESGIVDGFLHAGDRAFTGIEICKIARDAGLSLAYTMHRPWGDPRGMGPRLGLENRDTAYLLNYLDVWQSLRTNFILCFAKKDSQPIRNLSKPFEHPLFSFKTKGTGFKHRGRLMRFAFTGIKLQTRTYDGFKDLPAKEVRQLLKGKALDAEVLPRFEPLLSAVSEKISPTPHWVLREGAKAPNPMYAHYFDSLKFREGQWQSLENDGFPLDVEKGAGFESLPTQEFSEAGQRLSVEQQRKVFKFIDDFDIKRRDWSKGELLELWCLLFSSEQLFWTV